MAIEKEERVHLEYLFAELGKQVKILSQHRRELKKQMKR